ncbi:metallophosphoesterase family protein [Candidatus Similichlamydia epinepheli]|uniref:metallophosphoesterase family protein n=1 Tax=Candidatus Similichlamydia epinepheli TaxID=1903953 RepID=UPI000D3566B1|nr:metallophosphoesterase [Candidatus Similichlamydia epinepheli]
MNQPNPMRLAHLSDLHFFTQEWNCELFTSHKCRSLFSQLHSIASFSSRRQRKGHSEALLVFLQKRAHLLDCLLISGDLTTKGSAKECQLALEWLKKLDSIPQLILPGNHDIFQKRDGRNPFTRLLERNAFSFSVDDFLEKGLTLVRFPNGWTGICLDLTNTKIGHAQGIFSEQLEKNLEIALQEVNEPCVVIGHFPTTNLRNHWRLLLRNEHLNNCLLNSPHVKIYLHGHTHELHHRIWTNGKRELISFDSGSSLLGRNPTWCIYKLLPELMKADCYQLEKGAPLKLGSFTKRL